MRAMMAVAVALGGLGAGSATLAFAASSSPPAAGAVRVVVQPTANGGGKILITGAVGDYGSVQSTNKDGKPDQNGNYSKLLLSKGTFQVDLTGLGAQINKVARTIRFNTATCSASVTVSAPVKFYAGTGLYKGISGGALISETFSFIQPRYSSGSKKGQCNTTMNTAPVAQLGTAGGSGIVKFS